MVGMVTAERVAVISTYCTERQGHIQSLQKQEQHLNSAHQQLEVEQVEVKGHLGSLHHSLRSIQSSGQELRSKVSLLYLHLDALGLSQVIILHGCVAYNFMWSCAKDWECPVSLKDEGEGVVDEESTLQCSVCAGTDEQHLMTLCDTCNQCYHIACLDPPLSKVPKKSAKWGW